MLTFRYEPQTEKAYNIQLILEQNALTPSSQTLNTLTDDDWRNGASAIKIEVLEDTG